MIKKMVTAVVLGLCVALPIAVRATETITKQDKEDHIQLMAVIEALGVPVNIDPAICKQEPNWYGAYNYHGDELALCTRGDQGERLNTIRHEAFHLVQDLADCKIKDIGMVQPRFRSGGATSGYKDMAAKHYAAALVPMEAEAAWAADTFDAYTITVLLAQQADECGIKLQ